MFYTSKQAAEKANLKNTSTIRYAVIRGKLHATKVGRDWLISADELERWIREERHTTVGKTSK